MADVINLVGDRYDAIAGVIVSEWCLLGADEANASDAVAAALRTVAAPDWQPIKTAPMDGTLFLSPKGPTFRQLMPCDDDGHCADAGGWVVVLGCPEDGGPGVSSLYVPDGYLNLWMPMPSHSHAEVNHEG